MRQDEETHSLHVYSVLREEMVLISSSILSIIYCSFLT